MEPCPVHRSQVLRCFGVAITLLAACADADALPGGEAAPASLAQTVVDSVLPIEEEIWRFESTAGEPAARLSGGAATRDELVSGFVAALEQADTAALGRDLLDRSEFIHLYFPHTIYTRPPYQMDPAIIWFQMANNTSRGVARALRSLAGMPLHYRGYDCRGEPEEEGPNSVWERCVVTIAPDGEEIMVRLFGPILERDGRYKFVTYGNDL
jgi:hypothetical protein